MERKVMILGTEYTVQAVRKSSDPALKEREGYCYGQMKKIVVDDLTENENWKNEPEEAKQVVMRHILRHEIIHAFLFESGLNGNGLACENWEDNEEMVDWFALQLPKMLAVFRELECES